LTTADVMATAFMSGPLGRFEDLSHDTVGFEAIW
jgi:hypothetical protein